ncbi:MAG: AEC family transporter [Tahibacter sp.]
MQIYTAFAFLLSLIALGRLLAWRRLVPDSAPDALNLVVLYVCLPAAILLNAPKLHWQASLVGLVAAPWLLLLASTFIVVLCARLLRFSRGDTAVLLLEVPLGNTSFLGFALIPLLAGSEALRYAVVYDQLGSFLMLASFGLTVIAWYSGGVRPTVATILRRMLTFPPFVFLLFALLVMPAETPDWLAPMLQQIAGALLPLAALAIGMQMTLRLPREHLKPLALGLFGKLVLLPALALVLAALFGLDPAMRAAVVLESAMPPMITAAALASLAGLSPQLAAALVGYGTLLSALTLPLWRWMLAAAGLL